MRDNSYDRTVERSYIQKWRFLIREYDLVKAKKHTRSRFVQDFYNFHGTNRQTFAKYYNRYRHTLPQTLCYRRCPSLSGNQEVFDGAVDPPLQPYRVEHLVLPLHDHPLLGCENVVPQQAMIRSLGGVVDLVYPGPVAALVLELSPNPPRDGLGDSP